MTTLREGVDEVEVKIECRRSLHGHALKARRSGWSAADWEDWVERRAAGLVTLIGQKEVDHLVRLVWRLP